jgi:predicted ATPase
VWYSKNPACQRARTGRRSGFREPDDPSSEAACIARRSAWAVDPAVHQPVANLVVGGRGWWRVFGELLNHLAGTVQMLVDGGSPVDVGMEQPLQARPVATVDRIEHIAYGWDLLRHLGNAKGEALADDHTARSRYFAKIPSSECSA